jgi:hypothetical protein
MAASIGESRIGESRARTSPGKAVLMTYISPPRGLAALIQPLGSAVRRSFVSPMMRFKPFVFLRIAADLGQQAR